MVRPRMIAHRGASALAPENTPAAILTALELGAEWVETDVHLTRDNHLVCIHDASLDRTTNGSGSVRDLDLAEIKRLDAGSWFYHSGAKAPWERGWLRVPTLSEVLDLTRGRATLLIHLKRPDLYADLEQRLLDGLREAGVLDGSDAERDVTLQSFSVGSLRLLALLAPRIPRIQLILPDSDAVTARALDAVARYTQGVAPCQTSVTPEFVAAAHDCGLTVSPYTVNAPCEMRRLIRAGVDGIITDNPVELSIARGAGAAIRR
ncbi:MAG: glycerophosphodiester phosphodiesterase [Chloroflexia bacterium]|nr:glycerophosphodiester phosphodiesterase [Chloroflexia bacterium]